MIGRNAVCVPPIDAFIKILLSILLLHIGPYRNTCSFLLGFFQCTHELTGTHISLGVTSCFGGEGYMLCVSSLAAMMTKYVFSWL